MSPAPDVRLTMPARPEGVAVVRQALAGMADALDFDAAVLADMKMAVSEACTNVVVHAYDDDDGDARGRDERRRHGPDDPRARPRRAASSRRSTRAREVPALGLGLPLIAALSDAFEVQGGIGQGTEVRMTFTYARESDPAAANPVTGTVGDDGRWDSDAPRGTPAG